jgi:hypothetical protein
MIESRKSVRMKCRESGHFINLTKKDPGHEELLLSNMKITVFWDVAPYGLIYTDRRFGVAYYLRHQGD